MANNIGTAGGPDDRATNATGSNTTFSGNPGPAGNPDTAGSSLGAGRQADDGMTGIDGDDESKTLITSDKVNGTDVFNETGERLGVIDSIVIDKYTGEVAYVVMSFGGFLGIGEKYHPLPWDVLEYDNEVGGYRVDLNRDDLIDAPSYDREAMTGYDFDRDSGGVGNFYVGKSRYEQERTFVDSGDDANDLASDANDGRERPPGYYSSQAQADRNSNPTAVGFEAARPDAARNTAAQRVASDEDGNR